MNSAPYLCCATISCWLTVPFNHWFGRQGTIFITCCFSAVACLWQGFVNTWWHMFISRFALGFGIGPKSATVPIYAAETAPPAIRGALVMQWQMWTAFGIMFGYAADLAFFKVPDQSGIVGLNWRIMMASAMFPALVVCGFVFSCPESPRWYMSKKRYDKAYQSMCSLRYNKIQAARDLYYMHTLLEAESSMKLGQNKILELIAVPRNRRAMIASEIVMFMQQVRLTTSQIQEVLSNHRPVLRRQRHCLLLIRDLPRSKRLRDFCVGSISRLRFNQLALRHPSHLHHRYIRATESPPDHIPTHVLSDVLHGLQLLHPQIQQLRPNGLYSLGNVSLWHILLSRRRSGPIHLFSRSIPSIRPFVRYGASNGNNMAIQLYPRNHLAIVTKRVHPTGCIRLVRRLVYYRVVVDSDVHA